MYDNIRIRLSVGNYEAYVNINEPPCYAIHHESTITQLLEKFNHIDDKKRKYIHSALDSVIDEMNKSLARAKN